MPINRRLLKALADRDISTAEFLRISDRLDGVTGDKKRELQEELATEIEEKYPYRQEREHEEGN